MYFEDNAGVIVNNKGEMKGSAVSGPVAKGVRRFVAPYCFKFWVDRLRNFFIVALLWTMYPISKRTSLYLPSLSMLITIVN